MTDIAIRDDSATAPAVTTQPVNSLMAWAEEARQASQLAASLANTAFVPQSLRGNTYELTVSNVTAAILAGSEMGLPPMAALRSMDIINGTPALRAHAMRGLVQSSGHEIELLESAPGRCVMRGRRKGKERWQEVVWDLPRAASMNLVGKPEWKKQPQTMLIARATGEICRLIAADVLYAMPYAVEELNDSTPFERTVVARATRATFDEIAGGPEATPEFTVEQLSAPTSQDEAEGDASDDPVDEFTALWKQILAAGERRGWTAEQTEREFAEGNNGVQAGASEIGPLRGFLAFLGGAS